MSGLPIRAKDKHFKTIWEYTSDNSPTVSNSFFLKLWSSEQVVETVFTCSVFLFASHNTSPRTFSRVLPCRRTTRLFLREVFPTLVTNFSVAVTEFRDSNSSLCWSTNSFVRFTFTLSASQIHMVEKWCWFVKIHEFHQFLAHRSQIQFLSSHFHVIHVFW